jgi:bifunctional enzyme CysN/CysC
MRSDRSVLRLIVCGSVDDGKSTLVGRLLHDTGQLFDDRLVALRADSMKWGTQGDALDLSLLADGLLAEREQRITIDVAHCYFDSGQRKFIVIDAPGHEQYTRNMVTGASNADLAIVLVDARKGVLAQTRRHALIAHLLAIEHVVLAVNKMDLVGYSQDTFLAIRRDFEAFAVAQGMRAATFIPLSALEGENVVEASARMPWYVQAPLLALLETAPLAAMRRQLEPLRLPVQWVNRPDPDFRGFCGRLASGVLAPGMAICVQPSGTQSRIRRIVAPGGDRERAVAGESVTITLEDEIDVRRGDIISALEAPAAIGERFECVVVWMHEEPLRVGQSYLMKKGTGELRGLVTSIEARLLTDASRTARSDTLALNEIAICHLAFDRRVAFDTFKANPVTGGFIVIDPVSFETVGVGMLRSCLLDARHVAAQTLTVDRASRSAMKGQRPVVLWFTGLSGAGKSTIANLVEARLLAAGRHSYLLDGDNIRRGLNRDLGFTDADRVENMRRVAEVSKLMLDAGLIVLAAFISPFRIERAAARASFADGEFVEIHVHASLELAEQRDVKGLYKKARLGQLRNFTGIDSPYEAPTDCEIRIDTAATSAAAAADLIIEYLRSRGVFDPAPTA